MERLFFSVSVSRILTTVQLLRVLSAAYFLLRWSLEMSDGTTYGHERIIEARKIKTSLVETAWTFTMLLKIGCNFYYDFLNVVRKFSCVNISLLYSIFIKVLGRFILNLGSEGLQVLICICSTFKCSWEVSRSAAISVQNNFSHIRNDRGFFTN